MSEVLFDRLAKMAASGGSRRGFLKRLGGLLGGGFLMTSLGGCDEDLHEINEFCRKYCQSCEGLGHGAHGHCEAVCKACKLANGKLCGVCSKTNRVVTCCLGGASCCTPKGASPYCANLSTDAKNCGACGKGCTSSTSAPQGCCGGKCTDLTTTTNCGKCGTACKNGKTPACCSGKCADLDSDVKNCGKCGTACTTGTTPACCSGACTDLDSDAKNCGKCGNACGSGQSCVKGACVSSSSSSSS